MRKISKIEQENKNNVQATKNVTCMITVSLGAKCALCSAENPEYALDENQLCVDCYRTERNYWEK